METAIGPISGCPSRAPVPQGLTEAHTRLPDVTKVGPIVPRACLQTPRLRIRITFTSGTRRPAQNDPLLPVIEPIWRDQPPKARSEAHSRSVDATETLFFTPGVCRHALVFPRRSAREPLAIRAKRHAGLSPLLVYRLVSGWGLVRLLFIERVAECMFRMGASAAQEQQLRAETYYGQLRAAAAVVLGVMSGSGVPRVPGRRPA